MSTVPGDSPRKTGRPLKSEKGRKSEMLRFRIHEDLKNRVAAGAAASGRSLSEEAEYMLERFFQFEKPLRLMMDQPDVRELFLNISTLISTAQGYESLPGQPLGTETWVGGGVLSEATRAALRAGISTIIEHAIPRPLDFEDVPWPAERKPTPDAKRRYIETLNEMHDFGAEFGQVLTGQRPDIEAALDRGGSVEH